MTVLDTNKSIHRYFEEIAKIPHGSFKEEKIANYLEDFAKEQNLDYIRDEMHNIIMYKPASKGYENHEPVMLQGHMDMVNEKNNDSQHDFDNDPLDLYIEDGFLKAKGTTLGADDGCGVVYMLAILSNKDLKHPPLDCVFTVQEEVGLIGAMHIQAKDIHAKRMIGLDSGNEKEVCISSSGGRRTIITKKLQWEENSNQTYTLVVKGLLGGHSGGEIDKERGNANKIAIRAMYHLLSNDIEIQLSNIHGGLKENAIPRECEITFNSASSLEEINQIVNKVQADIQFELEFSDKDVSVKVKKTTSQTEVISSLHSKQIIQMMYIMPNGFMNKSLAIPGLTTVSLNMGVTRIEDKELKIYYSIRSPMASAKEELSKQLDAIASIFDCQTVVKNDYPGWQYDDNSPLRKQYISYVKQAENFDIQSEASHGGLETGIFKGLIPELDIITIGPDMYDIHTPDERLSLSSFDKCYNRLVGFLETL